MGAVQFFPDDCGYFTRKIAAVTFDIQLEIQA